MSGDSAELRNYAKIIAPYNGWVYGLYTGGTAVSLDLSTVGYPQIGADGGAAPDPGLLNDILANTQSTSNIDFTGCLGKYVRFSAYSSTSGAVMWVVFGGGITNASVTGANVPVIPTGTASLAGVGVPEPIPCGTYVDLYISANTRWIGLIGSSAGFLLIRPSSVGANG
jgi:hypothetical protein